MALRLKWYHRTACRSGRRRVEWHGVFRSEEAREAPANDDEVVPSSKRRSASPPAAGGDASRPVAGESPPAPGATTASAAPRAGGDPAAADGCPHYTSACEIRAPCCGKFFACRLCHDDAQARCPPLAATAEGEAPPDATVARCEVRTMDRYAVREMRCLACGHEQPISASCVKCAKRLGAYYCDICHLFDSTPGRPIYHCPYCNICRFGRGLGKDFHHCMRCNSCVAKELKDTHACVPRAMEQPCPLCKEDLFTSRHPLTSLTCGHGMHFWCLNAYREQMAARGLPAVCPACAAPDDAAPLTAGAVDAVPACTIWEQQVAPA